MRIKTGVRTDVGRVREGNEDSYLMDEPLFGIADGMGGHAAGEVASSTAVEALSSGAARVNSEDPESLVALIKEANRAIFDKATKDDSLHGMGTTCTLVLIDAHRAHLAHVGDSRAYLLRDGDLSRLSEDHTLVGRMVREGQLTEEEAAKHPQRSMITRSLGIDSDVRVDLRSFDVRDGDRIMLCSDGLTSMIDEGTIKRVLQQTKSPQAAADELVDLANEAGGDDNITVVVLDLSGAGDAPPPPPLSASPVERATGRTTDAPLGPPPSSGSPSNDDPGFGRRVVRKMVVTLVILAVLAGAGYGALRYSLNNSWFVGVNDEDVVTIYRGRPEEVLGISMKEVEEETGITLEDVPEFKRADLEEGIKTDSLEEAQATVDSLEELVQNSGRSPRQNEESPN
ncbi:MAG: Stp1/IreP family PP2C-type Ser/Thr phosphatase [Actinobacteria bacterium]|nr:Stp1/IreP family PP2C-type Ser/Thr phosphatase [Actinomycetota bacterium]